MIYHFVCPAKYRRAVFSQDVENGIKEICIEIGKRYEIRFLEIGTDEEHVHFLIQTVPVKSPSQIIQIVKSITTKEIFKKYLEVKKQLWGGDFWSSGYFVNTVGAAGCEAAVAQYVKSQGMENYKVMHRDAIQLSLF